MKKVSSLAAEPPLSTDALIDTQQLYRGVVREGSVKLPLSPAGVQASRLAATCDGCFVFASGTVAYRLTCSPTRKRSRTDAAPAHEATEQRSAERQQQQLRCDESHVVSNAVADDYLIPCAFSRIQADRFAIHSTHRAEIQSVSADDCRIASVDAYGRCIVTSNKQQHATVDEHQSATRSSTSCYVLAPTSLEHGEAGWCGVSLRPNDPSTSAITRQMYRDVTLFDADTVVRRFDTIVAPQAATFCGDGQLIGVAERKDLSLFDARVGENQGCIARKTVAHGKLLCMDASHDGSLIATGGMDRVLHMFDVRTMSVRERWSSCLKYEVAGTLLSRDMSGMAYVCSVDNEVACGACSEHMANHIKRTMGSTQSLMISGANARSARRAFGFRADVRIVGIARRCVDGEEIGAMSESGAFYLLRARRE